MARGLIETAMLGDFEWILDGLSPLETVDPDSSRFYLNIFELTEVWFKNTRMRPWFNMPFKPPSRTFWAFNPWICDTINDEI
jgi:hypothetical protein